MGQYAAFIDLIKARDTVNCDGLLNILPRLGYPPKFMEIICLLDEGQKGQVKLNDALSDPFPISSWVTQDYILAPTLFALPFSSA